MRKFHGLLFLGSGEWSVAARRLLHKRLDETLNMSGGLQQPERVSELADAPPAPGQVDWRIQAELDLQDGVLDVVAALTGRDVSFGAELPYPWADDFGPVCEHGRLEVEGCSLCGGTASPAKFEPTLDDYDTFFRVLGSFFPSKGVPKFQTPLFRRAFEGVDPSTLPIWERARRIANALVAEPSSGGESPEEEAERLRKQEADLEAATSAMLREANVTLGRPLTPGEKETVEAVERERKKDLGLND